MVSDDPFGRGPHPVGVRSIEVSQAGRGVTIPVEVWYPATAEVAGQDVDPDRRDLYELFPGMGTTAQDAVRDALPAPDTFPLVVFSHGLAGHRRQSTFLTTHLASHGYVVAAPDHVGNTIGDLMLAFATGDMAAVESSSIQSALDRPGDVIATIDAFGAGVDGLAVDARQVGVCGHSFGGWTTLQVVGQEPRAVAAVGLAAGGGRVGGAEDIAADFLDLDWDRPVPTLLIAAELDTILPLAGMRDLFGRVPGVVALVVLERADHYHFCDDAQGQHELVRSLGREETSAMRPFAELCPAADGERLIRGLTLAHLQAVGRGEAIPAEDLVSASGADAAVSRP